MSTHVHDCVKRCVGDTETRRTCATAPKWSERQSIGGRNSPLTTPAKRIPVAEREHDHTFARQDAQIRNYREHDAVVKVAGRLWANFSK